MFTQIIELIFIIDIILNFFTTYKNESGQEICTLSEIAQNYLSNWFFIDIISSVPTQNMH